MACKGFDPLSELWRAIPGFEGLYEASDYGRIRSVDRMLKHGRWKGRILSPGPIGQGYLAVGLCRNGRVARHYIHRLVLTAFCGPCPPGMEVAHGNGNRTDNCLKNLRWATRKENCADRIAHGTAPRGERCSRAKLTAAQVIAIRTEAGLQREIAARYGVGESAIRSIKRGKSWGWLAKELSR